MGATIVIGLVTMVLTFGGKLINKVVEHKQIQADQKVELMTDLCYKKDQCEPLEEYLQPKEPK